MAVKTVRTYRAQIEACDEDEAREIAASNALARAGYQARCNEDRDVKVRRAPNGRWDVAARVTVVL